MIKATASTRLLNAKWHSNPTAQRSSKIMKIAQNMKVSQPLRAVSPGRWLLAL